MTPDALQHPERDVRPLLARRPDAINAYAAKRIVESYDTVPAVLERCEGSLRGSALDVGCGAGHESFGLAAHFERVVAVDTSRHAIRAARRLARAAGVEAVSFAVRDAEREPAGERFDFILCNVMSHNGSSRRRLLERLRDAAADGAWFLYSEECEGYAPLEIDAAIERRDARALTARLRQVVNGCARRPGFRFYFAASASAVLAELGLAVSVRETSDWNGIPMLERIWSTAADPPRASGGEDPDYAAPEPALIELRHSFERFVGERSRGPLGAATRGEIERLAAAGDGRFSPFLLYMLMVDRVPAALRAAPSLAERAAGRLSSARGPRLDWAELAEVQRRFVELRGAHTPIAG